MKNSEILDMDYSGRNPLFSKEETHVIADIPSPFLVPRETPFYSTNLMVRADGRILDVNKDFFLDDQSLFLQEETGHTVNISLTLSQAVLSTATNIKIGYQKVFNGQLPYDYLLEVVRRGMETGGEIDWDDVLGKSDTWWPAEHLHDVQTKDETVGFGDLVLLFKQMRSNKVLTGLVLYKDLAEFTDDAVIRLKQTYQKHWTRLFGHITDTNAPHSPTKADLLFPEHPNWKTATLLEDREGDADDVISTPRGLREAIENFEVDTDGYLRQGSLPFTSYGLGSYIPPAITGSFEGMGTDHMGNALCVESTGRVVLLTRGFDAKVRQLYYYENRNIYDPKESFEFSGLTYKHPLLTSLNIVPNHIVPGSSGKVILLGDYEKNVYYIGLGNGTLDPAAHQLMKVDMAAFVDPNLTRSIFNPLTSYVMLIGDWVYLITQSDGYAPEIPEAERFGTIATHRTRSFYRIPVSDLKKTQGSTVTFLRQKMNYQNTERRWNYNKDYVDVMQNVTRTVGGVKELVSCGFDFTVSPTDGGTGPWMCQWTNMEDPSNPNIAKLRVFMPFTYSYEKEVSTSQELWSCLPYSFDTRTNTLTLESSYQKPTVNPRTPTITPAAGRNINEWHNNLIGNYCKGMEDIAGNFIPKLGYVAVGSLSGGLPLVTNISFMGYNKQTGGSKALSDWNTFSQNLVGLGDNGQYRKINPTDSPFGFASKIAMQRDLWEYDGAVKTTPLELFMGANDIGEKKGFFREATSEFTYIERAELKAPFIEKKILGRKSNTTYGGFRLRNEDQGTVKALPVVSVNMNDRYSVQYGLVNIHSPLYNAVSDKGKITSGLHYLNRDNVSGSDTEADGGFFVSLMGTHLYNKNSKTVSVDRIAAETLYVSRDNINRLLQLTLGNKYSDITNGKGGSGEYGEFTLTLFLSGKESGAGLVPSIAVVVWHDVRRAMDTYMSVVTFNWKTLATRPDGAKTFTVESVRYPIDSYGQEGGSIFTSNIKYDANGKWDEVDVSHADPYSTPTVMMDLTDQSNYTVWISSGINYPTKSGKATPDLLIPVVAGVGNSSVPKLTAMTDVENVMQLVRGLGVCKPLPSKSSGGTGLFVAGGRIPADSVVQLQSISGGGSWTVFVISDLVAVFNGSEKVLRKTQIDLNNLGIDPKTKTFYFYAVSGKVEGYYDLSLSERTSSPYHALAAVIKTNALGILSIDIEQSFAIAGFRVSTNREGGIVPLSSGTQGDNGGFKTVKLADLFDESTYN